MRVEVEHLHLVLPEAILKVLRPPVSEDLVVIQLQLRGRA